MSFDSKSASGISPNALIEIRDKLTDLLDQLSGSGESDSTVNVTDRAARDLGKVDVAGIDDLGDIAGQDTMANSLPVAVASDQSNVPISQATHDNLNLNANLQVGDADVANGNPVPVSDAGGAISIDLGGVVPQLDDTDKVAVSLYGKESAAGDTPVLVDASGNVLVSLATTLDSASDSIDVDKMSKGGVTTAHDAISGTATSSEIDLRGHNGISVECAVSAITSGNWMIEILGCAVSGGTFGNCYAPKSDGTFFQQKTPELDANGNYTFYFTGIPNYVEIKATRTTDGTLTCKVTPMNL